MDVLRVGWFACCLAEATSTVLNSSLTASSRAPAMIAEVLLVLAGHSSSLFSTDHNLHPSFRPLLHPGEEQCLQVLGQIASRYRRIKLACTTLSRSRSRYVCALCATLNQILKDEYETLVIQTEQKVLKRDPELVGHGSFVPLAAIRAVFAGWDAPLTALESLMMQLESQDDWKPGPLIDMLMNRSRTGIHRIADIISRLSIAVQRAWCAQLVAFLVHGSLAPIDPLASQDFVLLDGSMPSCVSLQSRESIVYIGRAVATVKNRNWQYQIPREQAIQHSSLLDSVLPEDQYRFDLVISQVRTSVSEWLWLNVLTRKDVEEAVVSLANYFLLRNGEFTLALIRDIEHLKVSRMTARSGVSSMIREQDLNLALLRASLGTSAQHDPTLLHLKFVLPSGPLRPLLPSLADVSSKGSVASFDDLLLGTSLNLGYNVTWPLDLFLHSSDLQIYSALFNYLSSLRKVHMRIHTCWTSLSNAQRARRRWTGLGEGGTAEDLEVRKELLRCGWGVVRDMGWFLDTVLGYVMNDVIDVEFGRLKDLLDRPQRARSESVDQASGLQNGQPTVTGTNGDGRYIDFTTLRNIHTTYLERLVTGCLLSNVTLTSILRSIFEVCERFVAQVERWGGDVLPALLFEGSLTGGGNDKVGAMVQGRISTVSEISKSLRVLLDSFYEELSRSTSQQLFTMTGDASRSIAVNTSVTNVSVLQRTFRKGLEMDGQVRRHVERLLLRLDFNGSFSRATTSGS